MSTEDLQQKANEWWAKMDEREKENITGPFLTPPARLHQNVGEYGQVPTNRDEVNPSHYARFTPSPIDVIDAWGLDHWQAEAITYIIRHDVKGGRTDLEKALWYITDLMERRYPKE